MRDAARAHGGVSGISQASNDETTCRAVNHFTDFRAKLELHLLGSPNEIVSWFEPGGWAGGKVV